MFFLKRAAMIVINSKIPAMRVGVNHVLSFDGPGGSNCFGEEIKSTFFTLAANKTSIKS